MRPEIEELLALVEAKKSLAVMGDGYLLQDTISSQVQLIKTSNDLKRKVLEEGRVIG